VSSRLLATAIAIAIALSYQRFSFNYDESSSIIDHGHLYITSNFNSVGYEIITLLVSPPVLCGG
jgi:hypothetical protein